MNASLEKLLLKQEQVRAQINDIKARENTKKRKADTRAKILLGAALLKQARGGNRMSTLHVNELANDLTSERDKTFLLDWLALNLK